MHHVSKPSRTSLKAIKGQKFVRRTINERNACRTRVRQKINAELKNEKEYRNKKKDALFNRQPPTTKEL